MNTSIVLQILMVAILISYGFYLRKERKGVRALSVLSRAYNPTEGYLCTVFGLNVLNKSATRYNERMVMFMRDGDTHIYVCEIREFTKLHRFVNKRELKELSNDLRSK